MPKPLVVILGPTASGKTKLAIKLARRFGGEIINADSRALYREFPILSAAPTLRELNTVPHHLVGIRSISRPINLYNFLLLARKTIGETWKRDKLPIVVGGSALYVNALIYKYRPAKTKTRRPMPYNLPPDVVIIGVAVGKGRSRRQIEKRFDNMLRRGVLKEVENFHPSFPIIGQEVLRGYLEGSQDLPSAKKRYVNESMELIKKQMTWFKRDKNIHWVKNEAEAVKIIRHVLPGLTHR